ncbi:lysophospholipid acyltransferase family protein [Sulfitobacter sp. LCG007]
MSPTWQGPPPPDAGPMGPAGIIRLTARGLPIALLVSVGLALLLVLRLFERPLCGQRRPVTPHVTVFVCRNVLRILGLRIDYIGRPMRGRGALVANHSSWLDIFTLNAGGPLCFVSKSEVARWPLIGWLARATGTLFIERDPRRAVEQTRTMRERLLQGDKLMVFPEGTSTDGTLVLPFKTTLFEAFLAPQLREVIAVQPVSVTYRPPPGADPRFYGWYGGMTFGGHLAAVLSAPRHGSVEITYHAPVAVREASDRKRLARACEDAVRAGFACRAQSAAGQVRPDEASVAE